MAKKDTPAAGLGDVRPSYLVDQVLSALQTALRNGTYKPGDKLPSEARLAVEFRVSRSTVREALRVLSHLGMVETWTGRGTFAVQGQAPGFATPSAIDPDDLNDIYHFRYTVEMEAAERAALNRTPEQLAAMKQLLARAQAGIADRDIEATAKADTDFHISILEAGGCRFAAGIYRANRSRIEQAARAAISLTSPQTSERALLSVQSIHDDLIDAIERQDARAAMQAVRRDQREVEALLRLRAKD
jgi:DNA-binding FadR family transcriptional regulator